MESNSSMPFKKRKFFKPLIDNGDSGVVQGEMKRKRYNIDENDLSTLDNSHYECSSSSDCSIDGYNEDLSFSKVTNPTYELRGGEVEVGGKDLPLSDKGFNTNITATAMDLRAFLR